MLRYIFLILLFVIQLEATAQGILLLNNGNKIEFKSYKFKGDRIELFNTPRGKMTVHVSDIKSYCSSKTEYTSILKSDATYDKPLYYFAEMLVQGKITLYKRTDVFNVSSKNLFGIGSRYTVSKLYLEKENIYEELYTFNTLVQNEDQKIATLSRTIQDNELLKAQVEDPSFLLNEESILQVVKEYNVSWYLSEELAHDEKSAVFFYLKDNAYTGDTLTISINDEAPEQLPKDRPLAIQLSTVKLSKVCVGGYCELLKGSECFIKYIEILIEAEPSTITFKQVSSTEANVYLSSHRSDTR